MIDRTLPKRQLGKTDLHLTALGFGASSIGAEFGQRDLNAALESVKTAIQLGINFIDTAAFYGRGMSEILLGQILPDTPRDQLVVSTKIGRYAGNHFDYSAKRVAESVDVSLERMRLEHLDMVFCHDIEYGDINQVKSVGATAASAGRPQARQAALGGSALHEVKSVGAR